MFYHSYMGSAPEIMVLWNNAGETAEVGDAVWTLIPWHLLLFLLPVLILQIFLLYRYVPPKLFYRRRLKWAFCFVVAYGVFFGALSARTGQSPSTGHRCARFGFLPTFTHDLIVRYFYLDTLTRQALVNETKRSFGLQSEYHDFSFRDIVVLQVESLDNAVMDYYVNGKPVVPFLNSLQENSFSYRIQARKRYASAGADFEMLTGVLPLDVCFNYRVPGLPYNTALTHFFHDQGYETFGYHGVHGAFFNRRAVFQEMGFDHLCFGRDIVDTIMSGKYPHQEEFSEEELADYPFNGWKRDDVMLKTILQEIQLPSERNRFFFVITATSHVPWRTEHIDNKDKLIPDETSIQERYLNSIHVVDHWLQSFYEGLPSGTLLIIYGDHTAHFQSGTFVSDLEGNLEFVPCFVHVVGNDIDELQRVPHRPKDQILSLRDVHSFLRDLTEQDAILSQRDAHEEEQKAATATPDVY
ncbi:MAG: LTA synthase family protein [Planctomycetaceae bacterium]|nr:LTA synthase family protein [Planctomycetaceae bacterium]